MPSDIILIGPVRTGKSTVGKLLAEKLNLPQVSLDELRWSYYREIGYDDTLARTFRARGGLLAVVLYWQLFDVYSVEQVLAAYQHCVFDFGAGVGVYESHELGTRIQQVLQPYPNVFLLLPLPDPVESLQILRARDLDPPADLNFDFNAHFLQHPGYYNLAKFVVYTNARTPEATCDEILHLALL